ncbi:MAG: LEA type 2 family protein [Gammaproteobacteria bacterium]|nr:LEA type 2 family protein [Gammaproteobacteria bacterium]MDH3576997.1 LEA type 2 family protein [Gammaproteobacteria bacterium]
MSPDRIISKRLLVVVIVGLASVLQACAGLRPGYETPTVTINSFRALPSQGALPNFEIGLHVVNPNREALKLRGVSYTVSLGGHELIKGVGNELPVIEAYGEGSLTLTASPNLFAGIRLVTDLMNSSTDTVRYKLEAKLDVGRIQPSIRVSDSGEISLRPSARQ